MAHPETGPVPVIDISAYLDGSDPDGVAAAVGAACRDIGFLVIGGHGVDPSIVERAVETSRVFLDRKSTRLNSSH